MNPFPARSVRRYFAVPAALLGLLLFGQAMTESPPSTADRSSQIEDAMFSRTDFFGSNAISPRPTSEANENLTTLAAEYPNDPDILENLAMTLEKLERFDEAEKTFILLSDADAARNRSLSAYYDRRGRFADEARVLAGLIPVSGPDEMVSIVGELLDLAVRHDLKEYLQPAFYNELINDSPNVFGLFDNLIDRLIDDQRYPEAIDLIRKAKGQFPDHADTLLDKEISSLLKLNRYAEAESVYRNAFDPFWDEERSRKFYDFLSDHDRLREYGQELKTAFKRDPSDFQTAIRLIDYRKYWRDEIASVTGKLERAKIVWSADELVTISRLLLRANDGEMASRFLYTLYLREDVRSDKDLRSRVLYQLFEMFSDAENQKLPLTNGDLSFYANIAKIDTDPGITTGILSLIFSDTDPGRELKNHEVTANEYFNRAAAYRIFLTYKEEFPGSPELDQMYLDIVRLYTAAGETTTAERTLKEFDERYQNSADFAQAALKLADAYKSAGNKEKCRAIYIEILDHIGQRGTPPASVAVATNSGSKHHAAPDWSERDEGIRIPKETDPARSESETPVGNFTDYLGRGNDPVSYREVLDRLISSLEKEKRTADILEVLSTEVHKYPDAEWLYEQRLTWLEKTNLTDDQLAVYREAISRFQLNTWGDKLARWFLRRDRQADFADLSADLVAKLSDREVEAYMSEMIDPKMSGSEFEKALFLQLYLDAHRRFPKNIAFVSGLLRFYRSTKQTEEWSKLAGEYFFISPEIRRSFIDDLCQRGQLAQYVTTSDNGGPAYKLFRADASIRLSRFEQATDAYRELNRVYPHLPEYEETLIAITRSFGQKGRGFLNEAALTAQKQAAYAPGAADLRTRSGEIFAELGNYREAGSEWEQLISTASGDRETYLDTATLYWDYFQYDDAYLTIEKTRKKFSDDSLDAFEAGAINEARHKLPQAIREYIKALAADKDSPEIATATRRLVTLADRGTNEGEIQTAFLSEQARQKDASMLSLNYAGYLLRINKKGKAVAIVDHAVEASRDPEFLNSAIDFFVSEGDASGKQQVLKRLADTAGNPRREIKYRMQLARGFAQSQNRDSARAVLAELLRKYPLNCGVVTDASDFFHSMGLDEMSVQTLKSALTKSRGEYKNILAGKLAGRLVQLDRLDEAETILTALHAERPEDADLFRELERIYVRKGEPDRLRTAFQQTVASLKTSDAGRHEIDDQVATLRTQMIDAFTRLRDYPAAVEQHIEIINREPDNEDLTDQAIAYVNRYGGGDVLLDYYKKTAAEAFKNYRWNVVLAKIYEAKGDTQSAVQNYRTAIIDQPEMIELYLAVADLETKRNDFDAALKEIDIILDLSDNDPDYIKKKIEVLKRAGRNREAASEQARLPVNEKGLPAADPFTGAQQSATTDKETARRLYREAFDAVMADPLAGEIKASDLVAYVRSVRDEMPLDKISIQLWDLRKKLIDKADEPDSTNAGVAKSRIATLDGAIVASIGEIARTIATDDEIAALHEDLKQRTVAAGSRSDQHGTLSLIQDIGRRARFGDLEEIVLQTRIDNSTGTDRQSRLNALLDFYGKSGAYEKALAAIKQYGTENLSAKARFAHLIDDRETELDALRNIYAVANGKYQVVTDPDILRYLSILYESDRTELAGLTTRSSPYQMQLINFLLGKGETALAHAAIENTALPVVWKRSRHAETALALKQFDTDGGNYFADVLQASPIGEMVLQQPDKQQRPIGDEWFRLSREYGSWLYSSSSPKPVRPSLELAAMIEEHPGDDADQNNLGAFYLDHHDPQSAIKHFRLATELAPDKKTLWADLGAALYLSGDKDAAGKVWDHLLDDPAPADLLVFDQRLDRFGLAAEVAARIAPKITKYLEHQNVDNSDEITNLIHAIAGSIKDEEARAAYFRQLIDSRPKDKSLAELLIKDHLVDDAHSDPFLERLIALSGSGAPSYNDYKYTAVAERTWTREDAESVYNQENDYKTEEPGNDGFEWQKTYLELLLNRRNDNKAAILISEIESGLKGRFARPAWLRLARLRLAARSGQVDLAECERLIGISVSSQVEEIAPPNLERFNDVLRVLKDEGRKIDADEISKRYFARMLAMGKYASTNFIGMARIFIDSGDAKTGESILRLMFERSDESSNAAALAEITGLDIVKRYQADPAKAADTLYSDNESHASLLELAAGTASDAGRTDAAIDFRRQLLTVGPRGESNRIELARLLSGAEHTSEAAELLGQLISDQNTSRGARWQARWLLHELGGPVEIPNIAFDPFAQYYQARLAANETDRYRSLTNSLLLGDTGLPVTRELMRAYAAAGKPRAALRLAETDTAQMPDELLDILSRSAETIGDYTAAAKYEKQRSTATSADRVRTLEQKAQTAAARATDLVLDADNTQKQ